MNLLLQENRSGVRTKHQDPHNGQKGWGAGLLCRASASLQELLRQRGQSHQQGPIMSSSIPLAACWLQLLLLE